MKNPHPPHPPNPPPTGPGIPPPHTGGLHPGIPHPGAHPLKKDLLAVLTLLLICCIAYWPLVFHVFSLKNDALNYFLPVRFQVSEAIYNHEYPFWSPYFNLGYALHGDMQSGAWNPVVQFISLFGPYSLYTLQLETVLYIFLSGVGMYFLLRQWKLHTYAMLFGATAYMLCGFNSDCCQYLNWISGAAWLPFVILFYYKLLDEGGIRLSLLTGFFLYLLFVSAYPAQFIITLYLLLSIFIHHVLTDRKRSGMSFATSLRAALFRHIPFLLCFFLLSLPAILSYWQYLSLSERGSGASYPDAMSNPLHPLLLFAWLTPLPIHIAPFAAVTDNLERNSWFGIIPFLFALTAYFIRTSDSRIKFAKIAVLVFLVMSLGELGGLRIIAYYILPLMNTFRHPAGLKLFTVFFSCLLAAWSLDKYISASSPTPASSAGLASSSPTAPPASAATGIPINASPTSSPIAIPLTRKLRNACLFCMGILALLLLFSLTNAPGFGRKLLAFFSEAKIRDIPALTVSIKNLLNSFLFKEMLFANAGVQLLFLWFFYRYAIARKNYRAVVRLSILNCLFFTFLFLPATVVKKDSAAHIQKILDENIVYGYPRPSLVTSLAENSADDYRKFREIGCLNMYNKKIGRVDYRISPCNLLSQNNFWFDTAFRNNIMKYPLVYIPDTSGNGSNAGHLVGGLSHYTSGPGTPVNSSSHFVGGLSHSAGGSSHSAGNAGGSNHFADSPGILSVRSFTPNHFVFASSSASAASYILLQNYYPLWKLKIDGTERPIARADISFMGFEVPAGKHTVEFLYTDDKLVLALWVTVLLTLVLLSLLCYHIYRELLRSTRDYQGPP